MDHGRCSLHRVVWLQRVVPFLWHLHRIFNYGRSRSAGMETKKYKHGFTLGKFMPPHAGHLHLINEARKQVEKLTVLVCSLEKEPIPGALRFSWMQQLFPGPDVEIVHVTDEVPSYPHEHPDFWLIWTKLLKRFKRD